MAAEMRAASCIVVIRQLRKKGVKGLHLQQGGGAAGVADCSLGGGKLSEEDDGHGVAVAGEVAADEHLRARSQVLFGALGWDFHVDVEAAGRVDEPEDGVDEVEEEG
jgi:hypothetical protein